MDRTNEGRLGRAVWPTVTLTLSVILNPLVTHGQCIDYGDYLHWVGGVGSYEYHDVAVAGSHAYVAAGVGMLVIDISTPSSARITGSVTVPSDCLPPCHPQLCTAVAVAGDYAYILGTEADEKPGQFLSTVDIRDPHSPAIIGSLRVGWYRGPRFRKVAASENRVWLAGGGSFVEYDVTDPASPLWVGGWGGLPYEGVPDFAISGGFAYVVSAPSGLRVLDLRDFRVVGQLDTPHPASRVAVSGDNAYLATDCETRSDLLVIDIGRPQAPEIVGSLSLIGSRCDPYWSRQLGAVAIQGNHVYVANREAGLQVVDVSRPATPELIGSVGTTYSLDVVPVGDFAFVATTDGLAVVDIANPSSPPMVARVETPVGASDVALSGNYAYVTSGYGFRGQSGNLHAIDLTDPGSPQITHSVELPSRVVNGVALAGDYAYVTSGYGYVEAHLHVLDVSRPESAEIVAEVEIPNGLPTDIVLAEDYAYVLSLGEAHVSGPNLHVVDINPPDSVEIVTSVDVGVGYSSGGLTVAGDYAYVAFPGELEVFDLADPTLPTRVGSVRIRDASGVAIAGGRAYVTSGYSDHWDNSPGGLAVLDLSNPVEPVPLGNIQTAGPARGVDIAGDLAYVVCQSGVQVVDVSDPLSPLLVGNLGTDPAFFPTPGRIPRGIVVDGDLVYVAGGQNLQIFPTQCQQPVAPAEMLADLVSFVASLEIPSGIEQSFSAKLDAAGRALARGNDHAARGSLNGFVHQVEAQQGRHIDEANADALIQAAEAIMAALSSGGMSRGSAGEQRGGPVSPASTRGATQFSVSVAGPHDRSTTIRYELLRPSVVDLAVYDVRGRRVRSFRTATTPAGPHVILWDGRDGSGSRVAAGVYFVRLIAGGETQTRKVVLLGRK